MSTSQDTWTGYASTSRIRNLDLPPFPIDGKNLRHLFRRQCDWFFRFGRLATQYEISVEDFTKITNEMISKYDFGDEEREILMGNFFSGRKYKSRTPTDAPERCYTIIQWSIKNCSSVIPAPPWCVRTSKHYATTWFCCLLLGIRGTVFSFAHRRMSEALHIPERSIELFLRAAQNNDFLTCTTQGTRYGYSKRTGRQAGGIASHYVLTRTEDKKRLTNLYNDPSKDGIFTNYLNEEQSWLFEIESGVTINN